MTKATKLLLVFAITLAISLTAGAGSIASLVSSFFGGGNSVSAPVDPMDGETEYLDEADMDTEYAETDESSDSYLGDDDALSEAQYTVDTGYPSKMTVENVLRSYEMYSDESINYALENVEADWNGHALWSAESFLAEVPSATDEEVFDYLTDSEYGPGFTEEEAQYAIDNLVRY